MIDQTTVVVFSFNGDQHLLSYCLKSIARNMPLGYREIILVWDDYVTWYPIDFDAISNEIQINFRVIKQSEIYQWPKAIGQWGWIKQQLAKLYCWKYVKTKYTWIVDGDVLLTGDPILFSDDKPILRFDTKRSVPEEYKFFMIKYLGINEFYRNTFVGSTALFDNFICESLDEKCREFCGINLVQAVDSMLLNDDHPALPFSEFECYGHFCKSVSQPVMMPSNWSYANNQPDWDQPIQIAWQSKDDSLDNRYQLLMQYQNTKKHE